jgi:hypothetical protein
MVRATTVYVKFSVNTDVKRREVFQVSSENIRMVCSNTVQFLKKEDN